MGETGRARINDETKSRGAAAAATPCAAAAKRRTAVEASMIEEAKVTVWSWKGGRQRKERGRRKEEEKRGAASQSKNSAQCAVELIPSQRCYVHSPAAAFGVDGGFVRQTRFSTDVATGCMQLLLTMSHNRSLRAKLPLNYSQVLSPDSESSFSGVLGTSIRRHMSTHVP